MRAQHAQLRRRRKVDGVERTVGHGHARACAREGVVTGEVEQASVPAFDQRAERRPLGQHAGVGHLCAQPSTQGRHFLTGIGRGAPTTSVRRWISPP